jgi:hypothetical protein
MVAANKPYVDVFTLPWRNIMMTGMKIGITLLGSALLLAPISAVASGSGGGGGGGNYPAPSAPRDPYADAYARGKSQFKKRITCKKCEYSQGVHDSVTAGKVAMRVKAGEFQLTEKQRGDVMIFLRQRYGITA